MPRQIYFSEHGKKLPVATEEELLEFANRLRAAGNAGLIDALLPSVKRDATKCLIARNLNFNSVVMPMPHSTEQYADGSYVWTMAPTLNGRLMRLDTRRADLERCNEQTRALAKAAKLPTISQSYCIYGRDYWQTREVHERIFIKLPKHIGNAADAFDYEEAFTDFHASK